MIAKTLILVSTVASISQIPAQEEAPDFAHDLAIQVEEVEALDKEASQKILEQVGEMVGKPTDFIGGIELYVGKAMPRNSKEMVKAWFARVPLGEPAAGGRVCLGMDMEGTILGVGVWGTEDFDTDETPRK